MTANEEIRNRMIRHIIWLHRYGNGQINELLSELEKLDRQLTKELAKYGSTLLTKRKMQTLQKKIKKYIEKGRIIVQTRVDDNIQAVIREEEEWVKKTLEDVIAEGISLNVNFPKEGSLVSLVNKIPFENTVLSDISSQWSKSKSDTFTNALKYGFYYGQTVDEVLATLFGTKEFGYKNGANHKYTNYLRTNVRTGIQHIANITRGEMYKKNLDLIKGEQWVSTLDTRTTPLCMSLDGKVKMYDGSKDEFRGHYPPAHYNCRSCTVPITKSWRELGINIDETTAGTRASMNGQVSATLTYPEWFKTQSARIQKQILGKTRYNWYKEGKFDFKDFIDNGNPLTIEQLKKEIIIKNNFVEKNNTYVL